MDLHHRPHEPHIDDGVPASECWHRALVFRFFALAGLLGVGLITATFGRSVGLKHSALITAVGIALAFASWAALAYLAYTDGLDRPSGSAKLSPDA